MTYGFGQHDEAIEVLIAYLYEINRDVMDIKIAITDLENSNYSDKRLIDHYEQVLSKKRRVTDKILNSISILKDSCK